MFCGRLVNGAYLELPEGFCWFLDGASDDCYTPTRIILPYLSAFFLADSAV